MAPKSSEIGRELRVSELKLRTVVWIWKENRVAMATVWVMDIGSEYVEFYAGVTSVHFLAKRCGPDLEGITDNTQAVLKIYEYLGEV